MTGRRKSDAEVERLRQYMDRMTVHARLTARHLDMPVEVAAPALVAVAFSLAQHQRCFDVVLSRVRGFLLRSRIAKEEDLE